MQQTHLDLSELCGMLLEDCKQTACRIVEACIQETNRTLREEKSWRKQQGLVLKEKDRPRRVLSEIGELPFQRGYYRDRLREEYVIPMDQLPGISAYERLLSSVGAELVHKATEFSYAKSAELVTGGAVTRQTVRNQIGKCRIPKWKPEQEKRAVRELHLFADEDHVPLQRPGKQKGKWNQQVPLVLVTEGVRPISGKRSQSIHPKYFVEETFDTGKLWKEVSGYLSQTYETGELERIWVHGDGGGWIRNGPGRIWHKPDM